MYKAIQELKTRAKLCLVSFLLLAAAIGFGFYSHDRTTSLVSKEAVVQQYEPQVLQIQKQPPVITQIEPESKTVSRKQYKVLIGDSLWTIATKIKPANVELNDYVPVLKLVNSQIKLMPGAMYDIPNTEDLKKVLLPDIDLKIDISDDEIITHLKSSEGTSESQAVLKRRLLGGKVGPSFKNGKFYPYRDSNGNFTIGYGHYLGKGENSAIKFKNGITKRQAHDILIQDMDRTMKDFVLLLQRKRATELSIEQQRILYEMAYTMGCDKLAKFNRMWHSIENSNSHKFQKEIKNSLWYNQVGNRADLLLSSLNPST